MLIAIPNPVPGRSGEFSRDGKVGSVTVDLSFSGGTKIF